MINSWYHIVVMPFLENCIKCILKCISFGKIREMDCQQNRMKMVARWFSRVLSWIPTSPFSCDARSGWRWIMVWSFSSPKNLQKMVIIGIIDGSIQFWHRNLPRIFEKSCRLVEVVISMKNYKLPKYILHSYMTIECNTPIFHSFNHHILILFFALITLIRTDYLL